MRATRECGILCHPTSLPGRFGIGDLGEGAYRLVDFLVEAGQSIWQVLPLGPTGYGDSPYQPFSAFAGNPLLISPDLLVQDGLLREAELATPAPWDADQVLYGPVIEFKGRILRQSYRNLQEHGSARLRAALADFCAQSSAWLDDLALFLALKRHYNWQPWTQWDPDIALREPRALTHWREVLREEVDYQRYAQFQFHRQWADVKRYANDAGLTIVGDMPIFMGHDSADVWSHRELFRLDDKGMPTVVAGVPPDYFSPTGQLWGNPHYRWDVLQASGYAWWLARLKAALAQVDRVRLDHFRGFAGSWEVPAGEDTAINGRWVRGPGLDLFRVVERELGGLPIIAEDLGLITSDVTALRETLGLPGMRVLQFAFDGDATNPHLPYNTPCDSVVYTGTHDNDTTLGWYAARDEKVQHKVRVFTGTDGSGLNWTFIRLAMNSVARIAVFPLQDVLGLGSEARLNTPGRPHGNWTWRYRQEVLRPALAEALREIAYVAGRWLPADEELEDVETETLEYKEPEA